jgi:hypothetical protein
VKIKLKKRIAVKKFKAIMDIGQKEERSDIISLLKIAQSHNNQLSEKIICDEFIFRDNRTMSKRILKICGEFGVIDENFKINEDGFQALLDNKIYRPQTGTYIVWATQDPIIPQRILNLEIFDENSNLKNEIYGYRYEKSDSGERLKREIEPVKLESVPEWIHEVTYSENIKMFDELKNEIRIQKIEEKIEPLIEERSLYATIHIEADGIKLSLEGLFEDSRLLSIFPDYKTVWNILLKEDALNWNWDRESLKISYVSLSLKEKLSMHKNLVFQNPVIQQFGPFENLKVSNILIEPISAEEADEWANWLLRKKISTYLFTDQFNLLKNEIQNDFLDFDINFDDRNKIAREFERFLKEPEIPDEFWFINAPLDILPIKKEA